jgi:hypothetical protein
MDEISTFDHVLVLMHLIMSFSSGEMMVGRLPCLFMDEISTGLDSSSTYLISKGLKNACNNLNVRNH